MTSIYEFIESINEKIDRCLDRFYGAAEDYLEQDLD